MMHGQKNIKLLHHSTGQIYLGILKSQFLRKV